MPNLNSSITGLRQTIQTKFVATSPPVFYPEGGSGYWTFGSGYDVTTTEAVPFQLSRTIRSGQITPGWRSPNRPLLPKALPITYQFEKQFQSGSQSNGKNVTSAANGPGSAGYGRGQIFTQNVYSVPFLPDESANWASQLQDKAIRKLLEGLKDMSFNAAQAIGERQQTINLVASTATRLAKSFLSLKKGNFAKAARDLGITPPKRAGRRYNRDYATDQAKAAGNAWLELTYGWKPLLSDVYGSVETLAKAQNKPNTQFKKKSGRAMRKSEPRVRTENNIGSAKGFSTTVQSASSECHVRYGVTYAITSPVLASLANVGITNPLLLAWELTPLSFVADWFLPIGNYLSSLDATLGLSFVDGYVTTFRKYTATSTKVWGYTSSDGYAWDNGIDESAVEKVYWTRTTLGSFPPAPRPAFKNPLSTSHMLSAMSLIVQTFKR